MHRFQMPLLPANDVVIGVVALWMLGPALRAAAIPPIVATRVV